MKYYVSYVFVTGMFRFVSLKELGTQQFSVSRSRAGDVVKDEIQRYHDVTGAVRVRRLDVTLQSFRDIVLKYAKSPISSWYYLNIFKLYINRYVCKKV